jgi:hypothetical protein
MAIVQVSSALVNRLTVTSDVHPESMSNGKFRSFSWLSLGAALIAGMSGTAIALLHLHLQQPLEINSDEGINVMKAWMLAHGHALYSEVWDDQPPLYTHLLAGIMVCCGWTFTVARGVTLAFTMLLFSMVYDSVRLVAGHRGAIASVVLLLSAPFVSSLCLAAMIGLPAIALAVASFWALAKWNQRPSPGWILLSGGLLAESLCTKGFTAALLLPSLYTWWILLLRPQPLTRSKLNVICMGSLWLAAVLGVLALTLGLWVPWTEFRQLIAPHLATESSNQAAVTVGSYLASCWPLTIAAMIGALVLLIKHEWPWSVVLGWWLIALLIIHFHRPLWWHHTLLATVPGAMLGGIGMAWLLHGRPDHGARAASRIVIGVALLAWSLPGCWHSPILQRPTWRERDELVLQRLRTHPGGNGPLVCDRCLYPFLVGRPLPADLVVATWTRIEAHALEVHDILADIDRVRPSAIIMTDRWQPQVIGIIARAIIGQYHLVLRRTGSSRLLYYERNPQIPTIDSTRPGLNTRKIPEKTRMQ